LIDDADVMTGWNSEGFDVPYLVNRVTRIMSKDDTRKFCLLGQLPKARKYERFGKEETTYDLVGRIHMDYLQMYKKYTYETRQSYKLDSIGEYEVGDKKVEYEGTLDSLYNKDFKKFIEYSRQDTYLLYKIHVKTKYLELANNLAHENTVLLPTVMGSVAMIEQAIYNEAHERNLIVPDKRKDHDEDTTPAAGAYVAEPKKGLHEWIGLVDIQSMYPSSIRALNMAPETIIGQVRQTLTDAFIRQRGVDRANSMSRRKNTEDDEVTGSFVWEGIFACLEYTAIMNRELGTLLTIDFENGTSKEMSAAEIHDMIFDSHRPWVISANGTIFTLEKEGVIPGLLTRWFSDRISMRSKMAKLDKLNTGIEVPPELYEKLNRLIP
jgi:DNA polymerase elongation subunit (family B)